MKDNKLIFRANPSGGQLLMILGEDEIDVLAKLREFLIQQGKERTDDDTTYN